MSQSINFHAHVWKVITLYVCLETKAGFFNIVPCMH